MPKSTLVLLLDNSRPYIGYREDVCADDIPIDSTIKLVAELAGDILPDWDIIPLHTPEDFNATLKDLCEKPGDNNIVAVASEYYGSDDTENPHAAGHETVFTPETRHLDPNGNRLRLVLLGTLPEHNNQIKKEDCDSFVPLNHSNVSPWDELLCLFKEIDSRTIFRPHWIGKSGKNAAALQGKIDDIKANVGNVRNAVRLLGDKKAGDRISIDWENKTFENVVILKDCDIEHIRINKCTFKAPVLIINCSVRDTSHIERCVFHSRLNIVSTQWHNDLTFQFNEHRGPLPTVNPAIAPWFCRCQFHHRFNFRGIFFSQPPGCVNSQSRGLVVLFQFFRCRFEGRVDIGLPDTPTKLSLYACAFKQGRHTEIAYPFRPLKDAEARFLPKRTSENVDHWVLVPVELRFPHCDIAGRIVVREHPSPTDPQLLHELNAEKSHLPYRREKGLGVNLHGATLTGSLNLRYVRVKWIHCERMTVLGGAIFSARHLFRAQKSDRVGRFRWWKCAADSTSVVLHELVHEGKERPRFSHYIFRSRGIAENRPSDKIVRRDLQNSIAQQYEDLRKAFSNAANSFYQEDYCHYKSMCYQYEADKSSLKHGAIPAAITLAIFAAAMLVGPWIVKLAPSDWGRQTSLTALWSISITAIIVTAIIRWFRAGLAYAFTGKVYKWLLGFGVLPGRAIVGCGILILTYALAYLAAEGFDSETCGYIRNAAETFKLPNGLPAWFVEFIRLFYFSTITFTTLGYGDNYAVGPLRVIAMSEAFVGALMIAMVTVALARQVIRR